MIAKPVEGKVLDFAKMNDVTAEPVSEDSEGVHYICVTGDGGSTEEFYAKYSDISMLRLAKPEHGSIEFSGRQDLGRGVETLPDGTKVCTTGTWDEITLSFIPDKGCRLVSAAVNGSAVEVGGDGTYTFNIPQLVDWTVTAEFEQISVPRTVTVNCGKNGTVTPGTASYEEGSEVTLTVTPDAGYRVKSVTLDGKPVELTDGKYTFTVTADCVFAAEFVRTSGGSSGGSSGGYSRPSSGSSSSGRADSSPMMNGKPMSWDDIAAHLKALPAGSGVKVSLNGETEIPAKVIAAIRDSSHTVEFVVDSVKSWVITGSGLDASADKPAKLSVLPGNADRSALRGVFGVDVKVSGSEVPAGLKLNFRAEFAGQFANVYRLSGGELKFAGCVKVGADGSVTVPGANAAGGYIVMVCEFSDLPGDADNDGVLNALDASAVLRDIVGGGKLQNPLMGDFNGDGAVNALDASAILRAVVGL